MDYKEKYETAIKQAKEELKACGDLDCDAVRQIFRFFPELKDSEDEKIRKALVELVHDTTGDSLWVDYNVHKEDAIAWLEKQDKNNMGISEATKQKLEDNLHKALERETPESWNEFLEKQGEQKPNCCDGQKPAWSEEDETTFKVMLEELEKYVMFKQYSTPLSVYDLQWFKSLKDRVQPQPQQEWSEEDKGNLLDVKCIVDEIWHNQDVREVIGYSVEDLKSLWHWLDNIWQRVKYPNDIWKPSDEQMADLWNMVCECRPADQQLLQDLYFGLKTLRGE